MSKSDTDRALLVGLLALQMNFIDRTQWLEAMRRWSEAKSRRVEDILLEIGALRRETLEFVVAMTNKHLELHGQQIEKSLAAISSLSERREDLRAIEDPEIDETMLRVTDSPPPAAGDGTTLSLPPPVASHERFRVLRFHAKGGLGEVSVARDQELNRDVALKQIQQRFVENPASRSRFVLEAEITGGLEHPGIVPVYSLGQYQDGRPFYAMRFIRGDSLREAIEAFHAGGRVNWRAPETGLQLRKLLGRFVDVCDAVSYAHSRGVLHRDLKPGNIMLGRYGETMVVDWGLAKLLGHSDRKAPSDEATLLPRAGDSSAPTLVGSSIGTPGYMSPEQAEGRQDVGPATDVYSLGATLYCLLTGKTPISRGEEREEFVRKVTRGEFPRPSELDRQVPRPLEAICLKALATDPGQRYATPRELAEDVERWLGDEPVGVCREPWLDRFARTVRHHRTAFAATSVLVVTGMIGLAAIVMLMRDQNEKLRAARDVALANERRAQEEWKRAEDNLVLAESNEQKARRERDRAETNRQVAEANERKAQLQRERAEENLKIARQWASKLLSLAERLASIPGQGQLRRLITDAGLKVLQELYDNQPDDPELRSDLARMLRFWANVALTDDLPAAIEANQKAAKLLEPLVADSSHQAKYRNQLSETLRDRGNLLKRTGKLTEARQVFERAREIAATLRKENPDDLDYLRNDALINSDFASLQTLLGQTEPALASSTSAVESLRTLTDGPMPGPLDPLLLLLAMHTKAELHRKVSQPREALDVLDEALRRAKSHAQPNANYQALTAQLLDERSQTLALDPARRDDAQAAIGESIETWERLVEQRKDSTRFDTYRQYLAQALAQRAELRLAANQLDPAQADLDKALPIGESLVAKSAENQSYRETMVLILQRQSRLSAGRFDLPLAKKQLERAIDYQREIVAKSSEHETARQELARLQAELKKLFDGDGQ